MKRSLICILLFITSAVFAGQLVQRQSTHAGAFYPAQKAKLIKTLKGFEKSVRAQKIPGKIIALVVPHAGYRYSGKVAAAAYAQLKGRQYDLVVLLGPDHRITREGVSVWNQGDWIMPMGYVSIDRTFANELIKKLKQSHVPLMPFSRHIAEHSLEVQLPFLQSILKNKFAIVPVLTTYPGHYRQLAKILYSLVGKYEKRGKKVLLIASTDLSHFRTKRQAEKLDAHTVNLLKHLNPPLLLKSVSDGQSELCGISAVLTVLEYADLLRNAHYYSLDYKNSGEITSIHSWVVGYHSGLIYQREKNHLTKQQGDQLVQMAKQILNNYVCHHPLPKMTTNKKWLNQKRAVFITLLDAHHRLRGCVGSIFPHRRLKDAIQRATILAATKDSRFPPVTCQEVKNLTVSVSVLSVPRKVANLDREFVLGKHGVVIKKGKHLGVFLPEVATDAGWNKEKFLNKLCQQKAGLPKNCWKDYRVTKWLFTSQKFE